MNKKLSLVLLAAAVFGCSHAQQNASLEERRGYFLTHDEVAERGGVGNYVDRGQWRFRAKKNEAVDQKSNEMAQEQQPAADDTVASSQSAPAEEPQSVAGAPAIDAMLMRLNEGLYFETGSTDLKPEAADQLRMLGQALKEDPSFHLRVEGYADNRGPSSLNRSLSARRALSVRKALIDAGATEDQLSTNGFGESKPIATNNTEEGRALNRRVELHPAG